MDTGDRRRLEHKPEALAHHGQADVQVIGDRGGNGPEQAAPNRVELAVVGGDAAVPGFKALDQLLAQKENGE